METKNLVVVFTDMAGFTTLTSSHSRKQISDILDKQDGIVREAVEDFKGEIVKSLGDGYVITFESPTNAVLAAMKIQEKITTHNAVSPSEEHFHIRITANLGDVNLKNGDVFGEPVNLASRILTVAEPDEIFFTESVYLAMNKNEIPAESLGKKSFKGIADEVEIYKVVKEQLEVIKTQIVREKNALMSAVFSRFGPDKGLAYALEAAPNGLKKHIQSSVILGLSIIAFGTVLGSDNEIPKVESATTVSAVESVVPAATPTATPTSQEPKETPTASPSPTPESNSRGKGKGPR